MRRNISTILNHYREDHDNDVAAAVASFLEDLGSAALALRSSNFHNRSDFTGGTILFLLDPHQVSRLQRHAQTWRDRPQGQKEQLAQKIVRDRQQGIPRWGQADVTLTAVEKIRLAGMYKILLASDPTNPELPDHEYLHTYFPELFNG